MDSKIGVIKQVHTIDHNGTKRRLDLELSPKPVNLLEFKRNVIKYSGAKYVYLNYETLE